VDKKLKLPYRFFPLSDVASVCITRNISLLWLQSHHRINQAGLFLLTTVTLEAQIMRSLMMAIVPKHVGAFMLIIPCIVNQFQKSSNKMTLLLELFWKCRSCFNVNFNVNFKIVFKTVHL
jgi:hypothetical protein